MLTCPNCGVSPLTHAIREMHYTYKGQSTTIPDVVVEHCAGCKEVMFAQGEHEHYGELVAAFRKGVDAQELKTIRAMRKGLGLTLQKADELFGDAALRVGRGACAGGAGEAIAAAGQAS